MSFLVKATGTLYAYRGTSGIDPKKIKDRFDGDGHFGRGTYFALTEEGARSYLDLDNPPSYITDYSIVLKEPLILINKDQTSGLFNTAKKLDLVALGLAEKFKAKTLPNASHLGAASLKAGYDGVILKGMIDGGDQILIPTGSKAKIKKTGQSLED